MDEQIESKLDIITNAILEKIPGITSILLTGGFGKGEGSVELTRNKKVTCLRDFDIAVIGDHIPNELIQQKIADNIYERLNLPNPRNQSFHFDTFVVDIKFLTMKDLIYHDIWFYDLKYASHILYGKDIRKTISTNNNYIPVTSGLRLLFEKVDGLLGVFSYEYLKGEIQEERKKLIVAECNKTFVEICTALCILVGEYKPRYTQRAEIFKDLYEARLPDLAEKLPDLPDRVKESTSFKLRPDFTNFLEDPISFWFRTRDCLHMIIFFYFEKGFGIKMEDFMNPPRFFRNISRVYYSPFLRDKFTFVNEALVNIISLFYQFLTNLEYVYVISKKKNKVYLGPLFIPFTSPSLKFFLAEIFLLFSLRKDCTINMPYMEQASKQLSYCIPINNHLQTNPNSKWEHIRKLLREAYRLYQGFHFVK